MPLTKFSEDSQKAFHDKKQRHYQPVGLFLTDANGRTWFRRTSGQLDSMGSDLISVDRLTTWATEKGVEIKMLTDCGRAE
ncbi:hypothetical protein ACWD5R_45495 [Streptomyces sp. NPDC002514]|uniref:hypothetical protein n=1 Tax=unclassified Streptomyces TaxID=2593676 RepID=UPI00369D9468